MANLDPARAEHRRTRDEVVDAPLRWTTVQPAWWPRISFLLALFEFFIFFAWIVCVFYVFADIFRSHDMGGGAKTLWCLFVIFVPFLGIFVYLIARGGGMSERALAQQQEMRRQQDEYVRSVAATSGGGSSADQIASAK
jgi:hypothetical protein